MMQMEQKACNRDNFTRQAGKTNRWKIWCVLRDSSRRSSVWEETQK